MLGKMRTIIFTYPGFQELPKGIKQLLLSTEAFYFDDTDSAANAKVQELKRAKFARMNAVTDTGKAIELRPAA